MEYRQFCEEPWFPAWAYRVAVAAPLESYEVWASEWSVLGKTVVK